MASITGVTTLQDAAAATGNGSTLLLGGQAWAAIQVTGTFVGTVAFEATIDGSTWVAAAGLDVSDTSRTYKATTTTTGIVTFDGLQGCVAMRARVSAYTSGSITAVANAWG